VFETTKRNVGLLMGATALTLSIGVGTAAGVVPQMGHSEPASVTVDFVPPAPVPADPGPAEAAPPPPPPPPTTVPTTTAPRPAPATTAAPRRASRQAASPGAPASAPAPAAPAGPTKAARLSPSSAEIQGVIAQVSQRIPLFRPTEAQVRQFGNDVCSAFDAGLPYDQVKAQVQQALPKVPLVTISSADVDYAIRTAVGLFCPGYAPLLP
jgi:outer membrane biosynthesis protein TonB